LDWSVRSPQTPTLRIYSKGNTRNLAGIGKGIEPIEKAAFGVQKLSLKRGKIGPRLLLRSNEKSYALSIGAKINDLG